MAGLRAGKTRERGKPCLYGEASSALRTAANSSGNLATFTAIRRASSKVSTLLQEAHAERLGIWVAIWPVTLLVLSFLVEKKVQD